MWQPTLLPPTTELDTKAVLRSLVDARSTLAELKVSAPSIPNQTILINALVLQEAKDSSAIENIITTHDELYKAELNLEAGLNSLAAKEVQNYISALKKGYDLVKSRDALTSNHILQIQEILEGNNAGYRKVPGTKLKNNAGEVVYTPPQHYDTIVELMNNLEAYINDDSISDLDSLIKMAVIHFQFESIHPFYDGNGRTGRIINILYLVLKKNLNLPILYLSRYIIKHKQEYYTLLQQVRDTGTWEPWILFILEAVKETSLDTIILIENIKVLMMDYKHRIRDRYKFYSQELINNLFKHPYTKIEFLQEELGVSRITATSYLNQLVADGILTKHKVGVSNYYINEPLLKLFMERQ